MKTYLSKIAHYHPEKIITNELLQELSTASPEWILSKTGIEERRSMWDYDGNFPGLEIVKRCLQNWKQKYPNDLKKVSLIISASTHDDIHYPNPGNFISEDEDLNVPVFQLKTACTSAAYAIYLAKSLITSTEHKDIIVLNGEAFTRYVDYGDKKSCILFGDAASIFTVTNHSEGFEILDVEIGGKGLKIVQENRSSETSHLSINEMAGGELVPGKPWVNRRRSSDKKFQQDGRAVVEFVLTNIPITIQNFLKKNNLTTKDIDHIILHQSNLIMMETLIDSLKIEKSKHLFNVNKFGNTSSAGWVTVLSQNFEKISSGSIILISVFGAGMTWSTLLLKKL